MDTSMRYTLLPLEDLKGFYDTIADSPGITIGQLARKLGWNYQKVVNWLIALEATPWWLMEDAEGRLWPFEGS